MNRKSFLKTSALGLLAYPYTNNIPKLNSGETNLKIGLASYTLREFTVDQIIAICKELDISDLALKSMHLPMDSSDSEIQSISSKIRKEGINLYGGGVIYMKSKAEVDNAFRYAKAAGLGVIIGVPNHELLPYVETKVMEYDIKLAIHNHGPGDKVYPTPDVCFEKVQNMDSRMGLCVDVGHVVRLGLDPITRLKDYASRIYDIHLKDVTGTVAESSSTQIGRGVMPTAEILKTLQEIEYKGVVAIEYEKNGPTADLGLAESIGHVRALLRRI